MNALGEQSHEGTELAHQKACPMLI
ncbi:hypothetical protein BOS5A_200080 [Bosea sp. EC-HK365B]|nr:hypothetical protein BOSE21B_100080 [Bosea sp. 21B]VVT57406.1 hypothetical protein BOS5A_200080 [Bosea sp. EC-HK365B]